MNDKKQRPFRLWYSQIQELRSLLSGNLKFAIFTATATRSTKQKILDSLEVSPDSLFLIQKDPNRDNIKYAVKYVENKSDIVDIFGPCINRYSMKEKYLQGLSSSVKLENNVHYYTVCSVPNLKIRCMQREKNCLNTG